LAGKENEFEIVDFLKYNFKASVGIVRAKAPVAATVVDRSGENNSGDEGEEQVRLPEASFLTPVRP
jgi:hypothetical protein